MTFFFALWKSLFYETKFAVHVCSFGKFVRFIRFALGLAEVYNDDLENDENDDDFEADENDGSDDDDLAEEEEGEDDGKFSDFFPLSFVHHLSPSIRTIELHTIISNISVFKL